MTLAAERFRAAYASAFAEHLRDPGERTLRSAYELGREAVERELGVLHLAAVHHEALASALRDAGAGRGVALAHAADDFFAEALSAFEMVQRGFREARDAAALERRHAEMLRQLSTFLADASLALDASESFEELLRLVAEQARELIGAACCVATLTAEGGGAVRAASHPDEDARWAALAERVDPVARHPPEPAAGVRGWLAAPMTTLRGVGIGAIQLFDDDRTHFGAVDEAVLLHLAQMASAAVERVRLHELRGG